MDLFRKHGDEERKGGRLQQAFETAKPLLNLSPQQENEIMEIFKGFREERLELRQGQREDKQEAIRAARKEAKQKIMSVLSDDQKLILQENLNRLKEGAE